MKTLSISIFALSIFLLVSPQLSLAASGTGRLGDRVFLTHNPTVSTTQICRQGITGMPGDVILGVLHNNPAKMELPSPTATVHGSLLTNGDIEGSQYTQSGAIVRRHWFPTPVDFLVTENTVLARSLNASAYLLEHPFEIQLIGNAKIKSLRIRNMDSGEEFDQNALLVGDSLNREGKSRVGQGLGSLNHKNFVSEIVLYLDSGNQLKFYSAPLVHAVAPALDMEYTNYVLLGDAPSVTTEASYQTVPDIGADEAFRVYERVYASINQVALQERLVVTLDDNDQITKTTYENIENNIK